MIRDPSDGSVREKTTCKENLQVRTGAENAQVASGLPLASTKSKDLAKLEKSREWLKQYHSPAPQPEGGEG